ncbi:RDD family protein [Pricia sp. S334]|uniref:RDD family protein n=1 Tax=Pricia mediterranea TaxID=3076079 RepID=A0ABU3L8E7_9FLAO|nr:RDD family protein [Pricia sp. S334]MDT7829999.1 RDD family protein [Pricia sp. S334]
MEQFQIETAQNISISQNTAHLGDRMLAYLIDSFIILVYYVLIIMILVSMNVDSGDWWTFYLLLSLPAFLYYVLLESFMDGQTVGKHLMQIRVVKLDGSKPSFSSYFIRWVLRIIDVVLTMGGVAVLTILIKGKGQRVGDIAAGTTVITEKKRVFLHDTLLRDLPSDYSPKFPQVTVFKDREMQTIKDLYDDARRNGNHNVIVSLSDQIKKVTEINTEAKPMDFVDVIIKDYSYYTREM